MKRHLIWITAGLAALTVAVPTIAAARDAATPDDNGVLGEVRGNCDEAEHTSDPACISVVVPVPTPTVTTPTVTTPTVTTPTVTTPTLPTPTVSVPSVSIPSNSIASNSAPSVSVPSNSVPGDISGPCDEAEHADDPRCIGGASAPVDDDDDRSGHDDGDQVDNDQVDDDQDDDHLDDQDDDGHDDDHDDDHADDRSGPDDSDYD